MKDNQVMRVTRRDFLKNSSAAVALTAGPALMAAESSSGTPSGLVLPPPGKRLLLACKLGMIAREREGRKLAIVERLRMAAEAGFDGVDFDEAGSLAPQEAREAVRQSGVFVHNAINHAHWEVRLTDPKPEVRAKARANLEHCLRVSHAAGGSGVLIVVGKSDDGPASEIEERCRAEIKQTLPLASALGQRVLVENVWNRMMYDHDRGPEQTPERFVKFVDSFNSPWVGMFYDIGNHWKYARPGDWIRAFGHRCVKLDVKGFSRAKNDFVDITSADDDLPWGEVRKALEEIGFAGWATAEVGGGDVTRLTRVREQMQKAFGV
jgi:hexulose-6-phosphate isomerase